MGKSIGWMRDRSPDVLDVLATISKQPSVAHVPAVCFGYAVLMYQRNFKLGMLQKLLTILLGSGGCSHRVRKLLFMRFKLLTKWANTIT